MYFMSRRIAIESRACRLCQNGQLPTERLIELGVEYSTNSKRGGRPVPSSVMIWKMDDLTLPISLSEMFQCLK